MAWFILGQIVTVLLLLVRIPEVWQPFNDGTWAFGSVLTGLRFILIIETAFHLIQIVVPTIGIYLTVKHDHKTPRFWFAYLASVVVYGIIDVFGAGQVQNQMGQILGNSQEMQRSSADMQAAQVLNLRLILWALVWVLYWCRSKRVQHTFGYRALERSQALRFPPI
jgi:hypothetical protein